MKSPTFAVNRRLTPLIAAIASACLLSAPISAAESTMPDGFDEPIKPELASKYQYLEDGELSDAVRLPIYQWLPADASNPDAIILGIHGLTLHGRRYRVLARAFAVNENCIFVAPDMRGFGRCRFDEKKQFSEAKEDRSKVNHEKSYQDMVKLAQLLKNKYKDKPLVVLGESLGCTFCVRLAGEHPELIDAMVLSAPAVKVNPKMYLSPSEIGAGLKAVLLPSHKVNLHGFITKLVSSRPPVVKEMLDDPFIVKQLSLGELLSTDEFVEQTAKWGKTVAETLPVAILQGSTDGCVASKHVTDLMSNMPSRDQTLFWRGNQGHLQLETVFVRANIIDALGDFIDAHDPGGRPDIQALEKSIDELGGQLVR